MVRTTVLAALATLVLPLGVAVTHSAVASEVAATCAGKPATIVVPESPTGITDAVTGTAGDDVIVGSLGDDTIDGAGGDDTICGLAGSDILVGGPGDDRLLGGLDGDFDPDYGYYGVEGVFGDVVVPGPGDDHVDLGADPRQGMPLDDEEEARADRISYDSAQAGVVVNLTRGTARGQGVDTIAVNAGSPVILVGSPHDDHLIGNDDLNWIAAGGGDDRVEGRGRNDMIWLDRGDVWLSSDTPVLPGDDVADGGRSNDDINSDGGRDVLRGGPGRDDLDARQPGATLHGGPGDDCLIGGSSADFLDGGPGSDRLYGGRGRDRCVHGEKFRSCEVRR
ncbi:MAG: hypothetical protein LT071_03230 [Nocardioides sp.]|nr:hypothetical protein [Nocardioides sp.]